MLGGPELYDLAAALLQRHGFWFEDFGTYQIQEGDRAPTIRLAWGYDGKLSVCVVSGDRIKHSPYLWFNSYSEFEAWLEGVLIVFEAGGFFVNTR